MSNEKLNPILVERENLNKNNMQKIFFLAELEIPHFCYRNSRKRSGRKQAGRNEGKREKDRAGQAKEGDERNKKAFFF